VSPSSSDSPKRNSPQAQDEVQYHGSECEVKQTRLLPDGQGAERVTVVVRTKIHLSKIVFALQKLFILVQLL
ncbi:hypothetical protein STEG23_003219, partial [Scotinomys teguina]